MSYREAMDRFGSDKPDLRYGLELRDVSGIAGRSGFGVFRKVLSEGGVVKGINLTGRAASFSRKALDELGAVAIQNGAKGLVWIKVGDGSWQSPVDKFFERPEKRALEEAVQAAPGDLIVLVADRKGITNQALGALRLHLTGRLGLQPGERFSFVWITEFPLFEYNESEGRLDAVHHPFTSPFREDLSLIDETPEAMRARAYDLVLNGTEIGGGSVRIHDTLTQERVFEILGISPEEAQSKFGFLLEALRYGAPPHAGMALGFDRLVAMMAGLRSIREVIAFPKTTSAACLLTDAPSAVGEEQLRELGLTVVER
jgi:aspartyl-tRNA synthetase